ncbi:MAG TPA: BON domain-containing protein, partial [Clostridia bacterium]|nr:BON domain-containing protein [Clostridia bacterium]
MKAKLSLTAVVLLVLISAVVAGCNRPATRSDAQIASEVQGKIMSDPMLQGRQVSVQAANGVVTLNGTVNSDAERQAASNNAGAVEGVKQVMNNLTVQQAAAPAAEEPAPAEAAPAPEPQRRAAERPRRATTTAGQSRTASRPSAGVADYSASSAPAAPANVAPAAPAAPPAPAKVTVPDGATVSIRLIDALDTETAEVGQAFRASLNSPLIVNDNVVVPENADVEGRVVATQDAGRFKGQSLLTLELTKISFNGRSYQVHSNQWSKQGASRGKNTAAKVGGGAALGAIIGGLAGGGKGAAIGA